MESSLNSKNAEIRIYKCNNCDNNFETKEEIIPEQYYPPVKTKPGK
jgi:uncharacterized protein YlaI